MRATVFGPHSLQSRLLPRHRLCLQVAMGFVKIANATMCRPIQALTQMRGYDVAQHILACFGGAGGQHACAIARSLGMKTIFVHHYSGILSAVGIGLADVVMEEQVRSISPLHRSVQLLQPLTSTCCVWHTFIVRASRRQLTPQLLSLLQSRIIAIAPSSS